MFVLCGLSGSKANELLSCKQKMHCAIGVFFQLYNFIHLAWLLLGHDFFCLAMTLRIPPILLIDLAGESLNSSLCGLTETCFQAISRGPSIFLEFFVLAIF